MGYLNESRLSNIPWCVDTSDLYTQLITILKSILVQLLPVWFIMLSMEKMEKHFTENYKLAFGQT